MGNENCCSRQQMIDDINCLKPEQNLKYNDNNNNIRLNNSYDKLNIIETTGANQYNYEDSTNNNYLTKNNEYINEIYGTKNRKNELKRNKNSYNNFYTGLNNNNINNYDYNYDSNNNYNDYNNNNIMQDTNYKFNNDIKIKEISNNNSVQNANNFNNNINNNKSYNELGTKSNDKINNYKYYYNENKVNFNNNIKKTFTNVLITKQTEFFIPGTKPKLIQNFSINKEQNLINKSEKYENKDNINTQSDKNFNINEKNKTIRTSLNDNQDNNINDYNNNYNMISNNQEEIEEKQILGLNKNNNNNNKEIINDNKNSNYNNILIENGNSMTNSRKLNDNNLDDIYSNKENNENDNINIESITNNNLNNNSYNNALKNISFKNQSINSNNLNNINSEEKNPSDSDILKNINLAQNPTFAPNKIKETIIPQNNNLNINQLLMNKKISNSGVRPNSSIFSNIDTKIIKKSLVKNNDNAFNKSYIEKYTQDLPGPLFTDQQIDEYIKQAEMNNYKNPPKYNQNQSRTIDYNDNYHRNKAHNQKNQVRYAYNNQKIPSQITYQQNVKNQPNLKKARYYYQNKNPQRKQDAYPLTPDYHIKRNKNKIRFNNKNPYDKYYNLNNNKYTQENAPRLKVAQYGPIKTDNTPLYQQGKRQNQTYDYNQSINNHNNKLNKSYDNIINNKLPYETKINNGQNIYKSNSNYGNFLTPERKAPKEIIIHSPTKVNPPIIQYTKTEVVQAKPIVAVPSNNNRSNLSKYNYNTQIPTKVYQPKKIVPKYNNNIQKQIHHVPQNNNIKTYTTNSILNQNYLKNIQKLNQNNNLITSPLPNNLYTNNNQFLNRSRTPTKLNKNGKPIYMPLLQNENKKLKQYQNHHISRRYNLDLSSNLSRNASNDAFSAPQKRRRNNFDYNDTFSYMSDLSSPKRTRRINYDYDYEYNFNNYKPLLNKSKVSLYQRTANANMGIITKTQESTGLELDENTKKIINIYKSLDLTNAGNFYSENYKLFYTNPEYFNIPPSEIKGKHQLKYFINNDPSKEAIYTGEVNRLNQRHGIGQLIDPYTTKVGTWRNGKLSGWSREIRKNGQVLEGKFDDNKISGKGIYKDKDTLYIGNFEYGVRQGKGVLMTKNFEYKGQFTNGKINGYGKIVFLDNKSEISEYEGYFKDNNIEGKGTMKWKNGDMYQGELKNGKMNGYGRFIPQNGAVNEGHFKDNIKISS